MRGLHSTIMRLNRHRRAADSGPRDDGRLRELTDFGPNRGGLRALFHVPDGMRSGAALVVVLHGCTQSASGYDRGSGWSTLADRHGFAVLFAEQRRANNSNLCFNWYSPADARRGQGEAQSIREMVAAMIKAHDLDAARVYVTGLSAGGAMAAVMLASYPEVFAGGAIIAGLPFATADNLPEALERMRGGGGPSLSRLGDLAATASPHRGALPALSVWHGTADHVVSPSNAEAIVAQWRGLHGLSTSTPRIETVDGHRRRTWVDSSGRSVIEQYEVAGMGHGVPLVTAGDDGIGEVGPHMFETSISSTRRIAQFWGLLTSEPAATPRIEAKSAQPSAADQLPIGVTAVIENALRSAGLMR